jgi:pimeloyl-ACP methyl ester carboxylesterase
MTSSLRVRRRNALRRDPRRFDRLYDRATATLLDRPFEEQWVETLSGETHVLLLGDPSSPPVVVFQGGNVTTPVTLAWFQDLADEFYLIAPDTPGEPGKSESSNDEVDYGHWVVDLLDGLALDAPATIGPSHGAGVVLETAALAPDRIGAAALVVPAGFGTPLSPALARVVLPSLGYRFLPRQWLLHRALQPMFTRPIAEVEDVTVETIALALRTNDLDADFPGPDGPDALEGFDAPAMVVSSEGDPFFPTDFLRKRLGTWLPGVDQHVAFGSERHFLSPDGQRTATDRIRGFFDAEYVPRLDP